MDIYRHTTGILLQFDPHVQHHSTHRECARFSTMTVCGEKWNSNSKINIYNSAPEESLKSTHVRRIWKISPRTPLYVPSGASAASQMLRSKHCRPSKPYLMKLFSVACHRAKITNTYAFNFVRHVLYSIFLLKCSFRFCIFCRIGCSFFFSRTGCLISLPNLCFFVVGMGVVVPFWTQKTKRYTFRQFRQPQRGSKFKLWHTLIIIPSVGMNSRRNEKIV